MGVLSFLKGRAGGKPRTDEELDRNVEEEIARNLWVRRCSLVARL